MRRDVQLEVMRRLIVAADRPAEVVASADELDVARYVDPAELEAEKAALLARHPVIVAHDSDLAEPGAFVTERVGDVPLVAVRDGAGAVRVFRNVCRHRGALLVDAERGCRKALTCRYHAWTYDLDGHLVHVPRMDAFGDGLEPASRGLVEVPSAVRHGFVWVRLAGDGPLDVAASLGASLDDDLAAFELAEHDARRTVVHERAANWKLVMDAFAEGYHLKALHRDSVARFFLETHVLDDWTPHVRQVGARKSLREAAREPEERWDLRALTTVFYNVFPNIVLVVHPDWITQLSLFPEAVDRVRVVHRMLVRRAPEDAERDARLERSFALIDGQVFRNEDLAVAESIQATLRSGTNRTFLLGGLEEGMHLFHRARDRALARS